MKTINIYTIIATYNGMRRNWIQKCLDSLLSSSVKTEIIVIDNGSTDGTIEYIQKKYPQVDLTIANENLGFAKANNIGIRKAYDQGADYFFLLNQDAWIEENTIEKLVEIFEQKLDAGIVSPIHLNGLKNKFDQNFAHYFANFHSVSDLYFNRLQPYYEVLFANAAAWLISRKCIETVGGFDTDLFYHYGEDSNYCNRVLYHGFKIYIATTTSICHDREDRKGKRPKEFQLLIDETKHKIRLSNILLSEKEIFAEINSLKLRNSMPFIILKLLYFRFNLSKLKSYRNELNELLKIAQKAKESRRINQKTGLHWL